MNGIHRAGLAAILSLAAACAATRATAEEPGLRDRPFLTVQGQGKVKARPDVARLSAVVVTRMTTLDGALDLASRRHAPRAKDARDLLDRLSGKGVAVRESAFILSVERPPPNPRGDGKEGPREIVATTRFDVEVTPVDGLDAAVSAMAASGLFEVQSVSYEVSDQKAQLDAARRAAMADALDQGRLYAEAGGFRIVGIVAVQDGQARTLDRPEPPMRAMRAMGPMVAPPPMQAQAPATIDTESSVSVTWRIEGGAGEARAP